MKHIVKAIPFMQVPSDGGPVKEWWLEFTAGAAMVRNDKGSGMAHQTVYEMNDWKNLRFRVDDQWYRASVEGWEFHAEEIREDPR